MFAAAAGDAGRQADDVCLLRRRFLMVACACVCTLPAIWHASVAVYYCGACVCLPNCLVKEQHRDNCERSKQNAFCTL